ncbi:MAG: Cupin protein [uncultured bacterium]|nr:MAG: Cupin protein [uncultured bacterium]
MPYNKRYAQFIKTSTNMDKVNIQEKLCLVNEYWKPVIVGELNNQHVKLVKIKNEFSMHHHENEDELFLVIKGLLKMDYGDRIIEINEGEFIIIPRGVKHRPIADSEVHLLLFEPETTLNTGNVRNELTVDRPKKM